VIVPALHHKIGGTGPHVILLHPVGLDLTFLEPVAAELCRSFTVLNVDLRGHGHSPASPPARSLDDYADDVHVLTHTGSHRPPSPVSLLAAWWRNTSRLNIQRMSLPLRSALARPPSSPKTV
jgi:pimeloyl-ACP methyl ester carboxylesterase